MRIASMAVLVSAALGGAVCLDGCVAAVPVSGIPYPPVPAPQAEIVPRPPVSEDPMLWQPGHWDWAGGSYVWTPGVYVAAAGHSANWQSGYWAMNPAGQYVWIPAHWL